MKTNKAFTLNELLTTIGAIAGVLLLCAALAYHLVLLVKIVGFIAFIAIAAYFIYLKFFKSTPKE